MKELLVKLAYAILKKYTFYTYPPCYFNGVKYSPIGFEYEHKPDESESLKIHCIRSV